MDSNVEEVWQLLRELIQSQKETDRRMQETDRRMQETDRRMQETDRRMQETDRQMQETDRRMQETDRRMQETDRLIQATDRQVKELGKQIGGLGAKFGSFTEGLALPSMEQILQHQFGMETVSPRVRSRKGDQEMEIDVLAYANGDRRAAYIVEVKSHPREEAIDQMKRLLQRFPEFFPEHQDKSLYGIMAAVDLSPELRRRILAEGLYVARIAGDIFALDVPEGFEPKAWN